MPITPGRQHTAAILRSARDDLHDDVVKQCEQLLEHDARVKTAEKELQRVTEWRNAAKLRLDAMRGKIEDVEAAYRALTGYDMPKPTKLK